MARVKAHLARYNRLINAIPILDEDETLELCGIRINRVTHRVWVNGIEQSFRAKEYELLKLLIENKGQTLTKEYLFDKIWGADSESEPQTLTVHIKWLRQKIERDPKNPERILTVWGKGYRYEGAGGQEK